MIGECVYTTDVHLDKDGYPRVKWDFRTVGLHRLIYRFVHGNIPEGMVIGHLCNNKGCINSHHLYLCTPAENSTHAARDGLYRTGYTNANIGIAADDWVTICDMYHNAHMSQREIGDIYGISQPRVSEILKKWSVKFFKGDNR